jgi:hypothetical protein
MDELYKNIIIPNLEVIQKELLNCIAHDYKKETKPHAFNYTEGYMWAKCPFLMSWLKLKSKLPLRLLRFYITPPHQSLGAHIDGGGHDPIVSFGMNIPVAGCNNTFMTWYKCDADNLRNDYPAGYLGGTHPKDYSNLEVIESLELIKPCFANNSIMHGVKNNSDEFRIMFTVRWVLHKSIGRTIDSCIDTTGMFEE